MLSIDGFCCMPPLDQCDLCIEVLATMPALHDRHAYLGRSGVTDRSGAGGHDVPERSLVFAKDVTLGATAAR